MSKQSLINNTIIFTDLDGTLINHHDYSFEDALPMLEFIKTHHIPLIIVTSKTKNEVISLQKQLGIAYPFIVENGAGIFIPADGDYETITMGKDHKTVRAAFECYAQKIPIRGFSDMDVTEIAMLTELPTQRAAAAKVRTFTEPFVLKDESRLNLLKSLADEDGLEIVRGGRFYHLITKGQDKANAIKHLLSIYEHKYHKSFKTIALGDSLNDLTMLQSVDHPILIPHPDGTYMKCEIPKLIFAPFPGPLGWNSALTEYFNV